ncbi:MAG TPA: tyrosinase family protein [Pyrinomonadaceae bacterium]
MLFVLSLGVLPLLLPARTSGRATVAAAAAPTAQSLRARKDIRAVEGSPDELKNLRHAFFMLKKRPVTCDDPEAKNEYDCWAAYHNNFSLYGCRHRIDLFWPWHRHHLAEFEKALRNSDPANPDRVRDVTLPYWNWTQPPSGQDFPRAVEQEFLNSGEYYPEDCPDPTQPCPNPLWVAGRRQNADCQAVKPACIQEALQLSTWRDFGGGDKTGQIGDFESQAHNFMHGSYIGGLMANPSTAAQDPIYWLFHAYIDNVWDQWQKLHQADLCSQTNVPTPTRPLRIGDWPPSTVQFKDALCAKDLGYEYAAFGPVQTAALPSCPAIGSGCLTHSPLTPVALRMSAAATAKFESAELRLSGVTIPSDFSYNAWVLLHPRSVSYRPTDKEFLEKYFATYFVAWRHGGHTAHGHGDGEAGAPTMELQLDVTRKLQELARAGTRKGLAATIVFTPADTDERATPLVFRRDVDFAGAALILTAGGKSKAIRLNPSR